MYLMVTVLASFSLSVNAKGPLGANKQASYHFGLYGWAVILEERAYEMERGKPITQE